MTTITTFDNLPINVLITKLNDIKKSPISFEELKNEILKKDETGNQIYSLSLKEDDDLCIIYYNNTVQNKNQEPFITELENSCRSIVLDKKLLKPIVTQYNKIVYNADTLEFIKDKNWNDFIVQKCYEGTLIMVFNHENKWYMTTRRCLNAQDSSWIKNNSYYEMFTDAMKDKFTYEELNANYCYHFVLVHHKNKNIVTYNSFGKDYKELFHILTTEKYTLNEINCTINDKIKYIENEKFKSLSDLITALNTQNELDRSYQKVTSEGYVLKYYTGKLYQSPFITLKLQTDIYDTIMKLKPNNSNIYQCFLELYQRDKLNDFLPYFTKYGNEVIKRIHLSMQNISKEILDLYHMTRNKQNNEIYEQLPNQYKKCLYDIHGLYIKNRTGDFNNGVDTQQFGSIKSINVFNVYHYLKNLPPNELRQIYYDRIQLVNNTTFKFINKNCINSLTQSTIMFKNNQTTNA